MLDRIPLRIRLTLAFAGVMAVVVAGACVFLRVSLAHDLDASIDGALRARATEVGVLVIQAEDGLRDEPVTLADRRESFAQILALDGDVLDSSPPLPEQPLLTPAEIGVAEGERVTLERSSAPGIEGRVRLLAVPVEGPGGEAIVVVGSSLRDRDEAVDDLTTRLLVGGPVALLLASLAGYWVTAGALRPVEAMRRRAARISGEAGGERLPVPAARDEVRRLGETLNDMLARIDDALARERAFVADASHELRTPLAILKTELELAQRGERTPDELRAAIASAGAETDRLTQLAEDLLVIARLDQGRLPVRAAPLDAGELLEAVESRFSRRAANEGRSITLDAEEGSGLVADRLRLEQALGNLVDNSLRYGSGPIHLCARHEDGAFQLHVLDEGSGLPPDFAPQAFERFTRADPARGRGGAGLGLAIVMAIARAHGGEAHVANREGGGLDAWLELPAVPAAEPVA
jgi:signal transduction histidine kinase